MSTAIAFQKGGGFVAGLGGFFEYGIAAVIGTALMVGFGIWSLVRGEA